MSRPGNEPQSGRYDEGYFTHVYPSRALSPFSINWWSARFYARFCRRILGKSGGRRVLEVGCGQGFIAADLATRFDVFGLDLSPFAIEQAGRQAPRARFFVADITGDLPPEVARGGFDLILARYVLEHLAAPSEALVRLAALLAPGGHLVFAVPNMKSPGRRLKGENWFGFRDPTHVSLLEPERWLDLTREVGLTVSCAFSDGLWDVPYRAHVPRLIQYLFFSLPTIATVLLGRPLVPPERGENLIVMARRGMP